MIAIARIISRLSAGASERAYQRAFHQRTKYHKGDVINGGKSCQWRFFLIFLAGKSSLKLRKLFSVNCKEIKLQFKYWLTDLVSNNIEYYNER